MDSKRRVNDIRIVEKKEATNNWTVRSMLSRLGIGFSFNEKIEIERYLAVLEKFQPTMKKLYISVTCSWEKCFNFLQAASEVEYLSLCIAPDPRSPRSRCPELPKFSKLKLLEYHRCPEPQKFFDAIGDDLLEQLMILHELNNEISNDYLQNFIIRQKNINNLAIISDCNINIGHLSLEALSIGSTGELHGLEGQRELHFLCITRMISDAVFASICQLRKLKRVFISLLPGDRSSLTDLSNLENLVELQLIDSDQSELVFWPGSPFLSQVVLSKLQELELRTKDAIDPEIFVTMGRGMQNLEELRVETTRIAALPRIIDSFKALKFLALKVSPETETNDLFLPRQNESLEELHIFAPFRPGKPTYDAINMCPKLKRFVLYGIGGLTADLVACVQHHTLLTSLHVVNFLPVNASGQGADEQLDPLLVVVIEHFRNLPDFLELQLDNIFGSRKQLVDDLIGDVANVYIDSKQSDPVHNQLYIAKKPEV